MSLRSTFSALSARGFQSNSNWVQTQLISIDYTDVGAVAGNGLYFVIKSETSNSIAIYFYQNDSFGLQQTINWTSGGFISSVSLDDTGTYLAFGITEANGSGTAGLVRIYTRSGTTWSLQQDLAPVSPTFQTLFGTSVSLTGDATRLVLGSPLDNATGGLYVYTRSGSTWTQEANILGSTPVNNDRLGTSVGINNNGNLIAAGAPQTGTGSNGKVITFTRSGSTWTQQQVISRPTGANGNRWGTDLSLAKDGTYFAATLPDVGTPGIFGGIGVFRFNVTWQQTNYFQSPSNNATIWYPGKVALNETASTMFTAGGNASSNIAEGYVYLRYGNTFSFQQALSVIPASINPPLFPRVIGTNNDGTLMIMVAFVSNVPNEVYIFQRS